MRVRAVVLVLASLVLAGCGGGGDTGHEGHSDGKMTETGANPTGFGRAGKPGDAARTVEVRMLDSLKFEPDTIEVKAGETVRFRVVNQGQLLHDFLLGDEATHAAHEKEMREMGSGHHMEDRPNGVEVAAGEQKELTWTFAGPGTVRYECHQPGHVVGGMVGTIKVT